MHKEHSAYPTGYELFRMVSGKHKILVLLLFLTTQLFAQDNYPRIEKIIVKDKLFHGQIDKHPITIYLNFKQISNYHAGVYSVEGWYYYDKFETKIPLAGLYDYSELILYNFNDTAQRNVLLNFREIKNNHWEDMDYYKKMKGFQEKFTLSENENSWTNHTKELQIQLEQNDIEIKMVNEYLLLDSTSAFDLHNFGGWTWNFELAAHNSGKYILKYEHMSRHYVMGMCGAGLEKGLLLLNFDQNNNLKSYNEFIYESCNGSISLEKKVNISNYLTVYKCYDYVNQKSFELKVDLKELKIEKKEQ